MRVIITGGSRGIGAACVRAFRDRGDDVVFLYRSDRDAAARLSEQTGACAIRADISDEEAVSAAFSEALRLLGGVDVLINNAGISDFTLFSDLDLAGWRRVMSVDLDGAFLCTRAVVREMIRQQSGAIVNVSSMWGQVGASCEVAYSTAKAGLIGLTKALAKELGPSHIRVNCIAPGVIDTDMNASLSEEILHELADETPLCRIGRAEEVAAAAVFLATDASSFLTGQVLGVNGGMIV